MVLTHPVVYFVRPNGSSNHLRSDLPAEIWRDRPVKIGYTSHLPKRYGGLWYPDKDGQFLDLIGCLRGGRQVERFMHKRFAAQRWYGEWFHPDLELLYMASRTFAIAPLAQHEVLDIVENRQHLARQYDSGYSRLPAFVQAVLSQEPLSEDEALNAAKATV